MTTSPSSREMPLAFPKVKSTNPRRTSSRLASRTSVRSAGNILHLPRLSRDSSQLRQGFSNVHSLRMSSAKCKIELAVKRVELQIDRGARCIRFDRGVSGAQGILRFFNAAESAGGEKGEDGRPEACYVAFGHKNWLSENVGVHLIQCWISLRNATAV